MKTGCLPARIIPHQPYLTHTKMMAKLPPRVLNRSHIDPSPRMLDNDTLGDCTSAGIGNAIRAISALAGYQTDVTASDAVMFYEESTGYDPRNPQTDRGGVETDVISYAMRHGYPTNGGAFYPLWGSVNPADRNGIANIVASLGVAYLGVMLAQSDMNQISATNMETTLMPDNHEYGDTTPTDGHCLLIWDYTGLSDSDTVTLLTWGCSTVKATWGWVASRIMEAHGLVFRQMMLPSGLYPTGPAMDEIISLNRNLLS